MLATFMTQNSLKTLPYSLKALIIEFLPHLDYPKIQLISKEFYFILSTDCELWGKSIFFQLLSSPSSPYDSFEEDLLNKKPTIHEARINLNAITNAKDLIVEYYNIKKTSQSLFSCIIGEPQAHELTEELFECLRNPNYPLPILKRDVHYFPTNTTFQNFLTEIYFGLQNKSFPVNQAQTIIRSIIEELSASQDSFKDLKELVSLRWYLFDSLKSKQDKNLTLELYQTIYNIIKNHCEMIQALLDKIKDHEGFLSEYIRLWKSFVLIIIEINRMFCPFSTFFNEISNKTIQGLSNLPEFSIWRIMVKIWLNEVFYPLIDKLHNAFRSTFIKTVTEDFSFNLFEPLLLINPEENNNQSEAIKYQILKEVYGDFIASDTQGDREERLELIKEMYLAICDLSYNEFSIFYWQCSSVDPETPKGILDSIIVQDTLQLYECCKKFLFKNSPQTIKLLKSSVEVSKGLFGKEVAYKVEEGQAAVLKDYLAEVFNNIIEHLDDKKILPAGSNSSPMINFDGILRTLDIKSSISPHEEKLKNMVCRVIEKDYHHFDVYMKMIMESKDQLMIVEREREEIFREIMERGFVQVQSGYEHFFTLNKDPLSTCFQMLNEEQDEGIKEMVRKDLMV